MHISCYGYGLERSRGDKQLCFPKHPPGLFFLFFSPQVLTSTDSPLWTNVSPGVQQVVKEQLLIAVREERAKVRNPSLLRLFKHAPPYPSFQSVTPSSPFFLLCYPVTQNILNHVVDTISDLAVAIFEGGGWNELLPFLFTCVQSNEPSNIESALSILAELAPFLIEQLRGYLPMIQQACANLLQHTEAGVRSAALRATSAFIQYVESNAERDMFQPLLPAMVEVINKALHAGDEDVAQEALEMLIEVADSEPRFLKKGLANIVHNMLTIANAEAFDSATRVLAAEFLMTLCEAREKAPGMMRKLGPDFTASVFNVIMSFLLDIEEDAQWHSGEREEDATAGEGDLFDSGQEYLDRLALSLGGKALAPVASSILAQWSRDADWRKRHAVLICLAQIAEGCSKQLTSTPETLKGVVMLALQGVTDPHPRVRWAVCQGMGQLCTDLGPDLQDAHHAEVMAALMRLMGDAEPRVQAHSTAAIVNFSEMADPDVMRDYLRPLIEGLLTLLQGGRRIVQEGALTALAAVADSAEHLFRDFYSVVMPLLLQIMTNANDRTHRLLRGKSIECITLVGMSVGIEVFGAHARQVCEYLMHLQNSGLEDDDPTQAYMIQAWTRLCKVMGADFLVYLDLVMPPLLKTAQLKPDIRVLEEGEEHEGEEGEDFQEINLGSKRIMIKTSLLDDKATACTMLKCYAEELKEGFWKYVGTVAEFMVPLMNFAFHDDVKLAAINSMPELVNSAKCAIEKRVPGAPSDMALVTGLIQSIWTPLLEVTAKEDEVELLQEMVDTLRRMVEVAGPLMDANCIQALFECLAKVIEGSEGRRKRRHKRSREEDFDEDEMEALADEQEAEESVADSIADVVGASLKAYGEHVLPLVERLLPSFNAWVLEPGRSISQRRIALGVYIDIVERVPEATAFRFLEFAVPHFVAGCHDHQHPELQQCCAYAIGTLAKYVPSAFPQIMVHAWPALWKICSSGRRPIPELDGEPIDEDVVDNAISSLGKILEFHRGIIPGGDAAGAAAVFVNYLPLKEDEYEARVVHGQLLRFMAASDPLILGEGNAHLPKIVSVFLSVIEDEDLAEEEDRKRMAKLLQDMRAAMGATFDAIAAAAAVTDKQREVLRNVFA